MVCWKGAAVTRRRGGPACEVSSTAILMKAVPGFTTDQYNALNADLRAQPGDIFAGCLAHVCVSTDSGVEIYDVWESEEAMDKFFELMMPIAEKHGLPVSGERPVISPVYACRLSGT
ncbi:hypothetical protein NKH18_11210 [Streptomyces sp. M10(2022)]